MSDAVVCAALGYRFGDVTAVDDVSFVVEAGEVYGLLGPNGAGKTTTIRMLTTLLKPQRGTAHIFGIDVTRDPLRVRQLLGYMPQQLSIDAGLTGWENVWLFSRLFDLPRNERRERIADALQVVGLESAADRMAGTFSGGMIRRLELAQALINRPRLLILDEPTIGLDPLARADVWERVQELRSEYGVSVLLTTHYMEEADELCTTVALMHSGRIRATGAPEDLKRTVGPTASLDDVFRHYVGADVPDDEEQGGFRRVRSTRRTAGRLG
jgi:ABC-2 type transport system ATP-binding protein